jgi:hypothetical protein
MKTVLKTPLWFTAATLCLVFLFAITGCDKFEKSDDNENSLVEIFAKVENPSRFSDVVEVKLVIFDDTGTQIELARGDWENDGFRIILPKTLNPNNLYTLINSSSINSGITPTINNASPTMTISDRNVKVVNADFLAFDKDGNQVTYFFLAEIDKDGNKVPSGITYFTYVDSDVTISDYTEEKVLKGWSGDITIGDPILYEWTKTTTYSIDWKKGWNVWRFTGSESFQDKTIIEEWTTIPISSLVWASNKW